MNLIWISKNPSAVLENGVDLDHLVTKKFKLSVGSERAVTPPSTLRTSLSVKKEGGVRKLDKTRRKREKEEQRCTDVVRIHLSIANAGDELQVQ
jgi:hypothetical protein